MCYITYSFIKRNEWGNPLFIIEWGEKMELLESIKEMVLPLIEQNDCYLDDIEYVKVSNKFLKSADVYKKTDINNLIGKFVTTGTSIPKGGMFYTTQVVEKKELPNAIFDEIPEGYTIYQLKVDNTSTYANSIFPGDIIDLWMKTTENSLLVFGEFISNVEVLAVRDSAGENVFDVTSGRTPAWLLFAVPTEMYRYLKMTEFISGVSVIPVPKNNLVNPDTGSTQYSSQELLNIIMNESERMEG